MRSIAAAEVSDVRNTHKPRVSAGDDGAGAPGFTSCAAGVIDTSAASAHTMARRVDLDRIGQQSIGYAQRRMRIAVSESKDAAAASAAREIARALREDRSLVLALPTGRTPVPFYRELVTLHRRGRAPFSRATPYNLDEFAGLGRGDAGSYRTYMRRHLFDHVDLAPTRTHLLNGRARSWRRETARFERELDRAGGLDIAVVGIGRNGHIGFNEPGPTLAAGTHRVMLARETRRANAYLFDDDIRRVPTHALSMGIGTILRARRVVLIATGHTKADILARALEGPVTTRVPASLLQVHPDVIVFADRTAAARLRARIR
jgi:glucosamine-6-phosphate deaminase